MDIIAPIPQQPTITTAESRAARALLGWSQQQLADKSGVSISTITDFEAGTRKPRKASMDRLRTAFREAGLRFLNYGDGTGVWLPKPDPTKADAAPLPMDAAKANEAPLTVEPKDPPRRAYIAIFDDDD
jgi:transcriptional regulator with XRE-family HTH domain